MADEPTVLRTALDLVVYAPLGLALTVGEEIPKFAAKGRARLGGRITTARMVGQFAVAQGRREANRRWGSASRPAPPTSPSVSAPEPAFDAAPARPTRTPVVAAVPAPPATAPVPEPLADALTPTFSEPLSTGWIDPAPTLRPEPVDDADVPDVASLAIPGYASLSASQVVQRLAGLSGAELDAVGAYEASSRGRRTILARVTQLKSR